MSILAAAQPDLVPRLRRLGELQIDLPLVLGPVTLRVVTGF